METNKQLNNWIENNLKKRQRINTNCGSSYGLKHVYEKATGEYVTNKEFKFAMWEMGFIARIIPANYVDDDDWNEYYNITRPSYDRARQCAYDMWKARR